MAAEHRTRAMRKLRDQVIAEEPVCWLQLPGCTTWSERADHLVTVTEARALGRPDLVLDRDNLRGACDHCNQARNDTPLDQLDQLRDHLEGAALAFFD